MIDDQLQKPWTKFQIYNIYFHLFVAKEFYYVETYVASFTNATNGFSDFKISCMLVKRVDKNINSIMIILTRRLFRN